MQYIASDQHLYTDHEIDALLKQGLAARNDIDVYAAQHPLLSGDLAVGSRQRFEEAIKAIFASGKSAVMPIEVSTHAVSARSAYMQVEGNHWCGLFFSRQLNGRYLVEFIDPASNLVLNERLDTVAYEALAQRSIVVARLVRSLKEIAMQNSINIEIKQLATQQQAGDLDCGAWTVDNLIRRAGDQPLRTNTQVTGRTLRQEHDTHYQNRFTF